MRIMAGYLDSVYYVPKVRNALRRERVLRDRLNSFDRYNDLELSTSTVLLKESVNNFINLSDADIRYKTYKINRQTDISPVIEVITSLRYFCTGSFEKVAGDL